MRQTKPGNHYHIATVSSPKETGCSYPCRRPPSSSSIPSRRQCRRCTFGSLVCLCIHRGLPSSSPSCGSCQKPPRAERATGRRPAMVARAPSTARFSAGSCAAVHPHPHGERGVYPTLRAAVTVPSLPPSAPQAVARPACCVRRAGPPAAATPCPPQYPRRAANVPSLARAATRAATRASRPAFAGSASRFCATRALRTALTADVSTCVARDRAAGVFASTPPPGPRRGPIEPSFERKRAIRLRACLARLDDPKNGLGSPRPYVTPSCCSTRPHALNFPMSLLLFY